MPDRRVPRYRIRGFFWELQGFYRASRNYYGDRRLRAAALTLWRGWRN